MIGYFGVAIVALFLAPNVGLALAGLALATHAVWDVVHYRRDIVVSRSMALWCIGLDVFLGLAASRSPWSADFQGHACDAIEQE